MKGHLDAKELESYKKEDLQDLARKLGVSDEGTKAEIAARCAAVEVDVPDESELTDEEKAAAEQAAKEAAEKAAAEQAAKEAAEKEAAEKAAAEQAAKEAAEKEAAEKAAAEQAAKEAAEKEAAEKAAAEQAAKEAAEKEAAEKAAAEQAAKEDAEKAAGKVKVEVTKRYLDKQLNQIKDAGETFTVDKARADELVAAKVAKIKG